MASIPKLSAKEYSYAVMGMLLGDGCLKRRHGIGERRIFVIQHGPNEEGYARYKAEFLKQFAKVKVYQYVRSDMNYINGEYLVTEVSAELRPHTLRHLNKFNRFYIEQEDGKQVKRIASKYIMNRITPLGLLFWWMDDGCLSTLRRTVPGKGSWLDRSAYLSTHAMDEKSMLNIQEALISRFNIETKIIVQDKGHTVHRLPIASMRRLIDVVRPHLGCVPRVMRRKFTMNYPNNYQEYSPWGNLIEMESSRSADPK